MAAINVRLHLITGDRQWERTVSEKTACGIILLVLRLAVPLRENLTEAPFSPRRCWGTDWNSFLQSVEVGNNNTK